MIQPTLFLIVSYTNEVNYLVNRISNSCKPQRQQNTTAHAVSHSSTSQWLCHSTWYLFSHLSPDSAAGLVMFKKAALPATPAAQLHIKFDTDDRLSSVRRKYFSITLNVHVNPDKTTTWHVPDCWVLITSWAIWTDTFSIPNTKHSISLHAKITIFVPVSASHCWEAVIH